MPRIKSGIAAGAHDPATQILDGIVVHRTQPGAATRQDGIGRESQAGHREALGVRAAAGHADVRTSRTAGHPRGHARAARADSSRT
jgi:hypothetical protein